MNRRFFAIFFSLSFVTLQGLTWEITPPPGFDQNVLLNQEILRDAIVQQWFRASRITDDGTYTFGGVLQDRQTVFLVHLMENGTSIDGTFSPGPLSQCWVKKESILLYPMSPNTGTVLNVASHEGGMWGPDDKTYLYISIKIDQKSGVLEFRFYP